MICVSKYMLRSRLPSDLLIFLVVFIYVSTIYFTRTMDCLENFIVFVVDSIA